MKYLEKVVDDLLVKLRDGDEGGRRSRRMNFSREVNIYCPTIALAKKSVNASLI